MISTTMEYSGVHKGENDFMLELYHSLDSGTFTVNGETYTIEADKENGVFVSFSVKDASGEEVGLLSDFVINAPDGTDTVSLANKEVIQDKVLEIIKNKMDVPAEEEDPDAEEPAPVEDEEIDEEELNPEGGDEESAASAKGVPIDLIFPKRVAGFNGVEPTLTQEYDENGEPVMGTMPGRVVTKISTTTLNGVTQEYKYYYISCDQWQWLMDTNGRPTGRHILGTDTDGYDVLARIMYGGRISLLVGFIVVFIETLLGVIMGGIAGYFGGWVDNLIMRLVDIFYCIPSMPILIILGAFMDDRGLKPIPRLIWMMAILGFLGWAGIARLVRGQILSLREQEFMVATEATGVKVSRRIFRHLIPNVMPQLIVSATAGLGGVILTESTLSFLGLGVKRPMATWGTIISAVTSSNENILNFTYIWIPVGLLICLTVIAFNFVGDGLRDAFDPKMKR
ncbi:MAG: ABC transporter permease [Oscillospiraceae bacterium]|nr:ABC transporter permease [Oscillospiraceae bacterium]